MADAPAGSPVQRGRADDQSPQSQSEAAAQALLVLQEGTPALHAARQVSLLICCMACFLLYCQSGVLHECNPHFAGSASYLFSQYGIVVAALLLDASSVLTSKLTYIVSTCKVF